MKKALLIIGGVYVAGAAYSYYKQSVIQPGQTHVPTPAMKIQRAAAWPFYFGLFFQGS